MEKISEINEYSTNDLDRTLLKNYIEASKDEDFQRVVAKLKLNEKTAMKYTSKLIRTSEELKNCQKCKHLGECPNAYQGCVYYPTIEGDRLRFDYIACKKKNEEIKRNMNRSVSFSEPDIICNANFNEIDKTDKNRAAAIKWILNFYKEYQKNKKIKGLFLHGSFGCGKSYLLAALLNELAQKGTRTVIVYYPELLRTLKESFNDDFKSIMYEIKNAEVLLIDDIGAEAVTEWSRDEILGTILQYRMDASLPTMFTSNLNINELETHLANTKNNVDILKAKRIIERIKQLTTDIEMNSENRRV